MQITFERAVDASLSVPLTPSPVSQCSDAGKAQPNPIKSVSCHVHEAQVRA